MEIKANSWYRTRGGEIAYVAATLPFEHAYPILGATQNVSRSWFTNGSYYHGQDHKLDLIDHLPDCDGFDWTPATKIQLEAFKMYLLANGVKVGPLYLIHADTFHWCDFKTGKVWNNAGERRCEADRATENIVAEYVEPDPVYEPWDFESMPGIVKVKSKSTEDRFTLFPTQHNVYVAGGGYFTYEKLFSHYEQLDGKPCGRVKQ